MNIEYHQHYSGNLGRMMEMKRYGHAGKVMVAFPSSGGSYYEFEDFGMIAAISWFIEQGHVQVFTPDSVDKESWLADGKWPGDKGQMHNRYDAYIIEEFVPFVKHYSGNFDPMIATGCSLGAFHAVNMGLRHPDVFDTVIALSGVYDVRMMTGEYDGDMSVYVNCPIDSLWNQNDPWFLDRYRNNDFIICTGQGAWEEDSVRDTRRLEEAFRNKGIEAWFDYWGHDVEHDWPAWRKQLPYYLSKLAEQNKI